MEQQIPRGYPLRSTLLDGVLTVTLPLSEDGLLPMAACEELGALLTSPPRGAQVLVLESLGTAFCLGREHEHDRPAAVPEALRSTTLMSVAKVHGDAAGFGVGLAALCDYAIAAPTARFSFPGIAISLAPVRTPAWLPQLVGRREAFRLTTTGATISAVEAEALGLLTGVAAVDDLDAQTGAIVETLRRRGLLRG
ncbi:MAG: enoyl-CoA hydratase/isomerase family protein [Mycobacterium sp.]